MREGDGRREWMGDGCHFGKYYFLCFHFPAPESELAAASQPAQHACLYSQRHPPQDRSVPVFRIQIDSYCVSVGVGGKREVGSSVADPDPGSGAFLTPGSGIRNRFSPDPGSWIPDIGTRIPDQYI
jgi:hypothetical protein